MMDKGGSLAGRRIVLTRPAHQAAPLAELIRDAGGDPLLFPVIEIADLEDKAPLNAQINRLDEFDRAFFVSPNAVHKAMTAITARRALPPRLKYAAVGRGTVRALTKFGVTDVMAPARFDSEALLEMPGLADVAGRRFIIFRGVGGRDVLGDSLTSRGAHIEYAECYRRLLPRASSAPLLLAWRAHALHAVIVTSSEGLHNLCSLVGAEGLPFLQRTPLFVPHARIAATAHELGFAEVVQTAQGDDGIVTGLRHWFVTHT